uniref:Uncharacterized protein n=1 Tax=Arundo donax TaxID=35708 RepID=A0A0A8Y8V2_ARUDO
MSFSSSVCKTKCMFYSHQACRVELEQQQASNKKNMCSGTDTFNM